MHMATVHRSSYSGQESQTRNLQLIFLTLVTVKQSQGYHTYNEDVDSKHGCNHAKFERSCFNGVREKANVSVFLKQTNKQVNYLS